MGMVNASIGLMLPSLAARTGVPLSQASIIFTVNALGYLLGSFLGGRLFDRIPGHRLLAGILVFSILTLAAIPITHVFWLLPLVFGALGLATGGIDVGGNTMLIWSLRSSVASFMNGLHLAFAVGTFIIPLVVTGILQIGWEPSSAYFILSAMYIPLVVWLLRLQSPTNPHEDTGGKPSRSQVSTLALVFVLFILYGGAQSGYAGWIFSYGLTLKGGTAASAGYLTSLYWGGVTLARLASIPLAIRLQPRTILLGGFFSALAGIALILLLPNAPFGVWAGTFLVGAGMAVFYPLTFTWIGKYLPPRGGTTGWYLVGGSVGMMAVPWLIGQYFETVGPQFTMYTMGIILVAAFLLFLFISARLKRPSTKVTMGN
jgi:FHS family Na+ dependent glucose MFS transporter 1